MDKTRPTHLSCGCICGRFLCPIAEHLWILVGRAYDDAKRTKQWETYDRLRQAYTDHFPEGYHGSDPWGQSYEEDREPSPS